MKKLLPKPQLFLKRNSSTILTIVGAVGVVATGVVTAKCTIKALDLLAEAEDEKQDDLTEMEVLQTAAPAYIPAVLAGAATITCMFGANVLNKRQQASLMSAYALLDRAYKDYKDKVVELYGEDSREKIKKAIVNGIYPTPDNSPHNKALYVGGDLPLYFDMYSMRYFNATKEEVEYAEKTFKHCVATGYACINDFYELLGIEPIEHGNDFGWFAYTDEVEFIHTMSTSDDGLECCIIDISSPYLY